MHLTVPFMHLAWETQKIDSPDNNSTPSLLWGAGCCQPPPTEKKMCSGGYRFFCAKLDDSSWTGGTQMSVHTLELAMQRQPS